MARFQFNRAPYFDDYVPGKNFMKVLFRPGRPVQTRELNTIQSIFQNQIESFASHIFKNGSRVSLCGASLNTYQYVRLDDISPFNNLNVDTSYLLEDFKLQGMSSGITASLFYAIPKEVNDPPTLYIIYLSSGVDAETSTFIPGEVIRVYDNNNVYIYSVKVRCPGCPGNIITDTIPVTGRSSFFSIGAGIFYFEGQFIDVPHRQTIVVSKYGEQKDYKIGFDFVQQVITSDDDSSILDNALGYPNSTAPGADRYKAYLALTKRALSSQDGDDFILLATIERGQYRYLKSDSEYSDIMDMIAKRTYETNGNFTVIPFRVRFIEDKAKDILDDMGYSIDGDPNYYRTVVKGGISYVKGYRYENTGEHFIKSFKARDTQKNKAFINRFSERTSINLIPIKEYSAYPNNASNSAVMDNTVIKMYDGDFNELNAHTGDLVGSFKVFDVNRAGGTIHDDNEPAIFKYYIYDLDILPERMLSQARSFVDENGVRGFKARPETNDVILFNPNNSELIWRLEKDNIKSLRSLTDDPNPPGSISISLRKKLIGILNSEGSVTFTSATNEYFEPYDYQRTVAVIIDTDQGTGIARTIDIAGKTSITSTQFIVNLGVNVDIGTETPLSTPGTTICIVHSVLRVNAQENQKTSNYIQLENIIPSNMIDNKLNLGVNDAYEIEYIIEYSQSNLSDPGIDITDQFSLVPNIVDTIYDESYLQFNGTMPPSSDTRWKYRIKYFTHNTSSNLGYFTIDSYRNPIENGDILYEDRPIYVSQNKIEYPLFSSFDFRPRKIAGDTIGTSVPVIGSTAIFDIEYYLGRVDLLCVNKNQQLYLKTGISSETPTPAKVDEDAMALYEIHLKPYTYSLSDISVKYIENKRYTMRDIGKIEDRVKRVEYYTALSILEKRAKDMSIKDVNGLDRFKNGIIADNFEDYQAADLTSSDFRACLDRKGRELRPSYTPRNKNLLPVKNESDCKFIGNVAIIDFDSVVIDEQPFATKHISINPLLIYKNTGDMVLVPNMDVWSDVNRLPDLTINVDTGVDEIRKIADRAGILGVEWGRWVDLNVTSRSNTTTSTRPSDPWGGISTTRTTTTQTTRNQERTGTDRTIESKTEEHDLGDRVTDVSFNPWMREVDITFIATKMLANTKLYAFFDGKPVSEMTRLINSEPGEQLITDEFGQIAGIFHCPGGVFHTGDRQFYLTTDPNKTGDPDSEYSVSYSTFFSGGLNLEKQLTTLNVITPVLTETTVTENRTVQETTTGSSTVNIPGNPPPPPASPPTPPPEPVDPSPIQPPPPPPGTSPGPVVTVNPCDPVAMGFVLDRDYFISGLDIYFYSINIEENDEIWIELRQMVNGYPSSKSGLTVKRYNSRDIASFVSENATVPFHAKFDFPVFIPGGEEHCFIVGGYSPKTRIWVARLGQTIIDQPSKILETQPKLQSSFRSQNSTTWNAEQYENIKYRLYAAKFKKDVMGVKFQHENNIYPLTRDAFEGQVGSSRVRVYIEDHGLLPGDKTTISIAERKWIWVDITNGSMRIGLPIRTANNSFHGVISDYKEEDGKGYIQIKQQTGSYTTNQDFICDSIDYPIQNNFLIESSGYKGGLFGVDGKVRFNSVTGIFREGTQNNQSLNGFSFTNLSKQHIVLETDSMDTFIIQIPGETANATGRFGGEGNSITINEKYELFNVSGAYITYGCPEKWSYNGYIHNPPNGILANEEFVQNKIFVVGDDNHLDKPHKIYSSDNALTEDKLVSIIAQFRSNDEWISPVINADSFSMITVSNRIEWITPEQFNVEPSGINRYKNESDPMNGTENYKYVTRTVTLKNPASDIVIAFDVYKDISANFEIWIKLVEPYESVDIDSKRWMRISGLKNSYHSVDLLDRVEYEITGSTMKLDVYSSNTVFTTSDWDQVVTEFSQFKVKLVGKSKNPALPPLFQSFRCIAIT